MTRDFKRSLDCSNSFCCHSSSILFITSGRSGSATESFSQVILEETTTVFDSISLSPHSILIGYPESSKSVIFSPSLTFLKSMSTSQFPELFLKYSH